MTIRICGKGELKLHMELGLLISRQGGQPDYLGGPHVITRVSNSAKGGVGGSDEV